MNLESLRRLREWHARRSQPPILAPGRNCWTLAPVGDSGLLIDGRDYVRESEIHRRRDGLPGGNLLLRLVRKGRR